ncbi:MAG: T9SS type A sorting domain-containing protein [Calditrichaeota bacterium]|nr:T9SS type A sorting domain-containing protein [Calditrichota bacterium]MCB0295242.1 T9SS type A sorting domain-containing protein [Calditrichota bacterium]MCB0303290.1 T9SS type A sorting domain-containing protein [Calditrichota bacterium]MCB0314937.1 T9SS type A sorting domain-containing protein [Calditrichota bacterium]
MKQMFMVIYKALIRVLVIMSLALQIATAQPNWMKYPGSPVLDVGGPGEWDAGRVNNADINFDGVTYQMWFTGDAGANTGKIGYASSTDGISWTKYNDPATTSAPFAESDPVLTPTASGWDSVVTVLPVVIVDNTINEYKMWYAGSGEGTGGGIGYATSTDGISWDKHGTGPVMPLGEPGKWDDGLVAPGAVIVEGSTYKMWYSGARALPYFQIGYATSSDGITWDRHPTPVLKPSLPGEWDDFFVYTPEVYWDGNIYHMWYFGRGGNPPVGQIGHATSPDGINWDKDTLNNPVLSPGANGAWDDVVVAHPRVIVASFNDSTHCRMWYTGNDGSHARIGLAEADSCVTSIIGSITDADIITTKNFTLLQNYPNPFNPSTRITYVLPTSSDVILKIYNLLGQEVRTLVNARQAPGAQSAVWDGRDNSGRLASSGIYIYQLQAGKAVQSRKMLLVR